MPPSNSRYMRNVVETNGKVATALGYRAKRVNVKPYKDAERRYEFEVTTLWGTTTVRVPKNDKQAAINEACPAFTEGSHDDELLKWLGRMAVRYDFEFTLKIIQKNGARWVVTVTFNGKKKKFHSPVERFPAARPLAEAVVYIYLEIVRTK